MFNVLTLIAGMGMGMGMGKGNTLVASVLVGSLYNPLTRFFFYCTHTHSHTHTRTHRGGGGRRDSLRVYWLAAQDTMPITLGALSCDSPSLSPDVVLCCLLACLLVHYSRYVTLSLILYLT